MRKVSGVAALLALTVPYCWAQTPPDALATAKEELRRLSGELNEAARTRDQAVLKRIFASDFVYASTVMGGAGNQADLLRMAQTGVRASVLPMMDFDKLELYGDVAVLRMRETNYFLTVVYRRQEGRWQIIQFQDTPLPSPRQAIAVDSKVLASYVGKYEQSPGRIGEIALQDGELRIVFPTMLTWTLRAYAEDRFFVADSLNVVMFHRTGEGRVQYYTAWFPTGLLIKGTRMER